MNKSNMPEKSDYKIYNIHLKELYKQYDSIEKLNKIYKEYLKYYPNSTSVNLSLKLMEQILELLQLEISELEKEREISKKLIKSQKFNHSKLQLTSKERCEKPVLSKFLKH